MLCSARSFSAFTFSTIRVLTKEIDFSSVQPINRGMQMERLSTIVFGKV